VRKKAAAKRPARKAPRKAAKKKRSGKKPARKKAGTARAASSSKVARKAVRGARRDKAFFDHFRARLLEERERIVRRLEGLRDELSGLQEMPRELEEWAQEEKDRDILIRLEERESVELRRIQAALERIDDGSYGLCQICGRSIPRDRLEELPTAFRCIEHSG
jgi:RNA polymerase-binding protein DksA